MNIFKLHEDMVIAAQMQCDKHVVKMVVESAQMLSTAHRVIDGAQMNCKTKTGRSTKLWCLPDDRDHQLYKAVHVNHPSTLWTRESRENYQWHYGHWVGLCEEYTFRYGKIHSTDTKLRTILKNPPTRLESLGLQPLRTAVSAYPECIVEGDVVQTYRNFYKADKSKFAKWEKTRKAPDWWIEHTNSIKNNL
jgi:hypothetical protein